MASRIHPRKLLVEGKQELRVIPYLIEHNGIQWEVTGNPIVYIDEYGGIEKLIKPGVIEAELKATGLQQLGIIVDANSDVTSRYDSVYRRCISAFPGLSAVPQATGVVETNSEGLKVGIWLMPDNQSHGMLETFLLYLCRNLNDPVYVYADQASRQAKVVGAPYQDVHLDKAKIHTWLAWQDEPGKQLHEAVSHQILDPNAGYAANFVSWFRQLYEL